MAVLPLNLTRKSNGHSEYSQLQRAPFARTFGKRVMGVSDTANNQRMICCNIVNAGSTVPSGYNEHASSLHFPATIAAYGRSS